jgi:outer membrane lipoprotein LolB
MQRRLLQFGAILWLSALAGCATVKPGPGAAVPADLADLDRWQAHGRLGVSGSDSGGSGSFDWQQRGDNADIQIRGPVGVGSVRLQLRGSADNPDLRMETGNGRMLQSEAAWRELEARLGAAVPAGSLRYWMLGVPAPGEHRWLEPAADGTATLEQAGWRIDYQRFSTEPGARVPVKFRAVSGDARVRIVVDRWLLGQ